MTLNERKKNVTLTAAECADLMWLAEKGARAVVMEFWAEHWKIYKQLPGLMASLPPDRLFVVLRQIEEQDHSLRAQRMKLGDAAQWIREHLHSLSVDTVAKPKRPRKLSAKGRANIIAATKARWVRYRAQKPKRH